MDAHTHSMDCFCVAGLPDSRTSDWFPYKLLHWMPIGNTNTCSLSVHAKSFPNSRSVHTNSYTKHFSHSFFPFPCPFAFINPYAFCSDSFPYPFAHACSKEERLAFRDCYAYIETLWR